MEKSFLQNLEKSFSSAKEKIDIQDFLNFVGAHPRLMTFVAGVGISVAFGWMGRFLVHEALATSAAASLSTNPASLHDVPVLQEGSEIKGFPPVIVDDQFKPPAFQEGSEIKEFPPVIVDDQFKPPAFQEGSEIKFEPPVIREGEFAPPGLFQKSIPTDK